MLWVDKYRPTDLDGLDFHDGITKRLEALAENPSTLPHLFFYGPSGSGKRTRIAALLNAIFGSSSKKLKLDQRSFTTPTGRAVDLHMVTSPHHVELSPSEAGNNDRYVIQDVLKEMASTKNIRSSIANMDVADGDKKKAGSVGGNKKSASTNEFKVVVLNEVGNLSRQAQAALRRTMEKYASTCRLILCCESPSKLIAPLRSRCLGVRIPAPSVDQVVHVLRGVAKKEKLTLPDKLAVSIASEAKRNVRKAVLMLEATKVQSPTGSQLQEDQLLPTTDWELYIRDVARLITREQNPQTLLAAREKLYDLLVNCIPPTTILKCLVSEVLPNLDDSLKLQVLEAAAFYEHRLSTGSKDIFHLEAFVAKYMSIYKKYLNELFM